MLTCEMFSQYSNAHSPSSSNPSGRSAEVSAVQSAKALSPIRLSPSLKLTVSSFSQSEKAVPSICSRVLGKETLLSSLHSQKLIDRCI